MVSFAPIIKNGSIRLHHYLVDIAPYPVLSRLEGLDDRMAGGVEMLGSMPVLGRVAATYVPTGETESKVDPGITDFQTVLTPLGTRGDVMYLIKMRTTLHHVLFLPLLCNQL
jgi:hypothetical protein